MVWKEPGNIANNHQTNDPWKNNNSYNNNNYNTTWINKITKMFSNNFNNNNNNNNNTLKINYRFTTIFFITIISIWIISGFYTIKESDKGVVFRFGKYINIVEPGLNWKPTFIENIIPINVETIREQATNGMMLTSDENVIQVEMNVQYKITNPDRYLFNVVYPNNSLRQAMDSAVRGIIGQSEMEQILTTKRSYIRDETRKELENTIKPYNMGISILDVNFQTARPPEAVKAAFDDVIAAREEEQKTIREAQAYSNEVLPLAKGNAQKIIQEAIAYKSSIVLKAKGEVASFAKILPQYHIAPEITRERLYIETMEKILSKTRKIITNNKNNSIFVFPLEELLNNKIKNKNIKFEANRNYKKLNYPNISPKLNKNNNTNRIRGK